MFLLFTRAFIVSKPTFPMIIYFLSEIRKVSFKFIKFFFPVSKMLFLKVYYNQWRRMRYPSQINNLIEEGIVIFKFLIFFRQVKVRRATLITIFFSPKF